MKQQNVTRLYHDSNYILEPIDLQLNEEPVILTAIVISVNDDQYELQSVAGRFFSQCAFSCLVKPEAGDKVTYLKDETGCCYVLNILKRESRNMSLKIPGDLDMQAENGQLTMTASVGLNLVSKNSCSIITEKFNTIASEADMNIKNIKANGERLDSTVNEINVIAHSVTTVAGLIMQRVKNCFRAVEVLEKIEAGQMITSVKKLFSVRSKQTMVTAEQDVKIDGERVHIG